MMSEVGRVSRHRRLGEFHGIGGRASFMACEVGRVSCQRSGEFHVRGQASFMSEVRRVSCQRSGEFHGRGQASFIQVRRVSCQRSGEFDGMTGRASSNSPDLSHAVASNSPDLSVPFPL